MNSDSENFEQLRRLLALKRHEQPPPGYFDGLSRDVIARIKAGDQGQGNADGWMHWLWTLLEAKPMFAGAFGAAICAVLVSGILNSEEPGIVAAPGSPAAAHPNNPFGLAAAPVMALNDSSEGQLTTNPVPSLDQLFELYPSPRTVPASFNAGH
jgi:hypothetical protein